jgi:N-acetylneuraminic acid mutarotase
VYSELAVVVSISGEAKPELLSTWMRYEVAPLTGDQSKVGVVPQVPLPSEGDMSEGVEGSDRMVKLRLPDQELSPQELEAPTRQ